MAGVSSKTIGERVYSFGTLPALEAVKVELMIVKSVGEPLFKAAMTESGAKREALAAQAVAGLTTNLNEQDVVRLINICMQYVTLQEPGRVPGRVNVDQHFTGRNLELWQVLIAFLQFNFADFFPESLLVSLRDRAKGLVG